MTYDPYKDIVTLTGKVKNEGVSVKDVYDLVTNGNSFYRSTYKNVGRDMGETKDYIMKGTAYTDKGANAIRQTYADYADRDLGHTAADIAGQNGGNLNSYAAAQANRSAAAMLTAGEEAVRERANSMEDRLLKADDNLLGVADGMTDAVSRGIDTAADLASVSAGERKSALDDLLALYGVLNKKI